MFVLLNSLKSLHLRGLLILNPVFQCVLTDQRIKAIEQVHGYFSSEQVTAQTTLIIHLCFKHACIWSCYNPTEEIVSVDVIILYYIFTTTSVQLKCYNAVLHIAGDGDTEVFFMGRTTD